MGPSYALNLFDRFHLGHQALVDRLVELPDPVAIVTADDLMGKDLELMKIIQPAEYRLKKLNEYLESLQLRTQIRTEIFTQFDEILNLKGSANFLMYQGPCCTEIESGALDHRKTVLKYSDTLEYLKPVRADDGDKLTSARIRQGIIDRTGKRLAGTKEPPRFLKLDGRGDLKAPKGEVFHVRDGSPEVAVVKKLLKEQPKCVIAVGDVTSDTVINEGFTPDVCIVDGITKRGKYEGTVTGQREYSFYNPAAVLFPEAWSTIATAIEDGKKSVINVEGEEDLMGFPAVLLAPNNSVMIYGQPDVGIVWVPVNKSNKKLARDLLKNMPVIN
jgi:uncharacterized protein (UPF0218 family)/phosphopantetheine adenylyltransferase